MDRGRRKFIRRLVSNGRVLQKIVLVTITTITTTMIIVTNNNITYFFCRQHFYKQQQSLYGYLSSFLRKNLNPHILLFFLKFWKTTDDCLRAWSVFQMSYSSVKFTFFSKPSNVYFIALSACKQNFDIG